MAVLSREDFLANIRGRVGEDTSDEAMKFIEDMTDTFDDLVSKTSDKENWKAKYEENDKAWRTKYRDRFFSSENTTPAEVKVEQIDDVITDGEETTFEDLFVGREG